MSTTTTTISPDHHRAWVKWRGKERAAAPTSSLLATRTLPPRPSSSGLARPASQQFSFLYISYFSSLSLFHHLLLILSHWRLSTRFHLHLISVFRLWKVFLLFNCIFYLYLNNNSCNKSLTLTLATKMPPHSGKSPTNSKLSPMLSFVFCFCLKSVNSLVQLKIILIEKLCSIVRWLISSLTDIDLVLFSWLKSCS